MNGSALNIVAVIPIKPLSDAKSRLCPYLDRNGRETLVLNMLHGVIRAATNALDAVWVVGGDPIVENLAKRGGATWRPEEGANVNQSLEAAFQAINQTGQAALYLPSDLPFIRRRDLVELISATSRMKNVVLAPAHRDGGTNAILLPRDTEFRLFLGPGSFRRHLSQATCPGLDISICYSPGLALDLDTWEDVQAYKALEPGFLERLTTSDISHA